MKDFYISDCSQHESQVVTSNFVVASKQVKNKKNGEFYLSLTLADRSGQIQANMWDNVTDTLNAFEQDDFVKVKGMVQKYNGRWQLTVHKVRKLGDSEIDYADYLPKTSKDIDQLWRTVGEYVESFQNPWLKRLVQDFMADEAIATAYKNAPAAKTLHHAFVGGLLDHVVSLFTVCDLASRNYPQVNRDLLLTGAFLHDIGKIHELAYQRSISYTTAGQLLGHMIIELEMLHDKLADISGFPDELKILIEHLIISHHGHYEFGSPKLPMFPEALMLHYLDDLDSKMESMRAQFEREGELETAWTSYNPSLGRPLLNTKRFLDKGGEKPAQTAAAEPASDEFSTEEDQVAVSAPASAAVRAEAQPRPDARLDALQQKFALNKPTPAGVKSE
ncbi:MAG TPA: OB-fold nucleic acid binding domain-containing protein [Candidatus Angelobacter sp.]|jgi:3'-5' exoribonuclease|nr:OB-fold nucleic acid binding domain-containing protein [Candidatus Angelobacter sp.]